MEDTMEMEHSYGISEEENGKRRVLIFKIISQENFPEIKRTWIYTLKQKIGPEWEILDISRNRLASDFSKAIYKERQ